MYKNVIYIAPILKHKKLKGKKEFFGLWTTNDKNMQMTKLILCSQSICTNKDYEVSIEHVKLVFCERRMRQ